MLASPPPYSRGRLIAYAIENLKNMVFILFPVLLAAPTLVAVREPVLCGAWQEDLPPAATHGAVQDAPAAVPSSTL